MKGDAHKAQRLYMEGRFNIEAEMNCSKEQAHYLGNVLRLGVGARVLVFNGMDGEWLAEIVGKGKKTCVLALKEMVRAQVPPTDLYYCFAPIKRARLDYMVQKAVEMGASRLMPVRTEYTQVGRINRARAVANSIEAAEQCGILNLPEVDELRDLGTVLECWDAGRRLVFCDEAAAEANALEALKDIGGGGVGVLIGPEGGFSEGERKLLLGCSFVLPISLGARIMRADTAAVAAMALVNAVRGF